MVRNYSRVIGSFMVALFMGVASGVHAETELGQAVRDLGGSELLVNAADAIYVACVGLATTNQALSPDQQTLGGRCADMTQQGFFLAGNFDAVVPAADTFGLSSDPDSVATYLGLLRQFSGEEVSSQGRYATEGATDQFKSLSGRLGAIRRGVRTSGFVFNMQGVDLIATFNDSAELSEGLVGGAAGSADADTGFAWFANMEYGFGDRNSTDFENGYDANSFGGVLGVDYGFNENWVAGVAFSYTRAEVEFDRVSQGSFDSVSGGEMETDSTTFSAFANYVNGRFYSSAIISFGQTDYDMDRSAVIPLDTGRLAAESAILKSDTESDQFGAQLQLGYTFGEGVVTYDVYGGYDYLNVEVDGFAETGSPLGLVFDNQDIDSSQAFLGASVRRVFNMDFGVLVPYISAEYRREFDNNAREVSARYGLSVRGVNELFQGETDDFQIPTDDPDDSFFDLTAGVAAQFGNNIMLFGQISSTVGLKDTSANLITIGLRGYF